MELYIDPREGSKKLLKLFEGECEAVSMDGADVAFFGNGPDDKTLYIGIEYKQLDDIVACIKSGRFTGTQLPEMMKIYDFSFLLVEGIARIDRTTSQLVRYRGKAAYGMGLRYSAFDNFLTSVNVFSSLTGKPCVVKMCATEFDTVQTIRNIYNLFQKPWREHKSLSKPDLTKIQNLPYKYDLEIIKPRPDDANYPQKIFQKMLYQVDHLGWDQAEKVVKYFQTMENAVGATQKEIESIEGIGKTMAKRIYRVLHGQDDPTAIKRKKKGNDNETSKTAKKASSSGSR